MMHVDGCLSTGNHHFILLKNYFYDFFPKPYSYNIGS